MTVGLFSLPTIACTKLTKIRSIEHSFTSSGDILSTVSPALSTNIFAMLTPGFPLNSLQLSRRLASHYSPLYLLGRLFSGKLRTSQRGRKISSSRTDFQIPVSQVKSSLLSHEFDFRFPYLAKCSRRKQMEYRITRKKINLLSNTCRLLRYHVIEYV